MSEYRQIADYKKVINGKATDAQETYYEYPPAAFYFKVEFSSTLTNGDNSFQEVSGISMEVDLEPVPEGGENRFVHQLPKGVKHPHLELKRGVALLESQLVTWCKAVLEGDFSEPITPQTVNVYLLNAKQEVLRGWIFNNAFPVKWDVEPFNSTKNEVAIEKITLSYTYSQRVV
jgi:phage tail-like protein